jgi:hypothetical protein
MITTSSYRFSMRAGLGLALCAAVLIGHAQGPSRSVHAVPQRQSPVLAPGALGPGAPNPAGLPSPIPSPAGLTSQFPAGLPPPATPGLPTPTDTVLPAPTSTGGGGGGRYGPESVPQTAAMGAGGYGVPAGPQYSSTGAGPYTALQIAQSFLRADANRDGELTRAEAQRLTILPSTFDEMDRNHDGILTRSEYEDALR